MADQVSFDVSREDRAIIHKIIERVAALKVDGKPWVKRSNLINVEMSIIACHANGCPLRLAELLAADDFNFVHDVGGIDRHVCHETGKMLNCFLPRFFDHAKAKEQGL